MKERNEAHSSRVLVLDRCKRKTQKTVNPPPSSSQFNINVEPTSQIGKRNPGPCKARLHLGVRRGVGQFLLESVDDGVRDEVVEEEKVHSAGIVAGASNFGGCPRVENAFNLCARRKRTSQLQEWSAQALLLHTLLTSFSQMGKSNIIRSPALRAFSAAGNLAAKLSLSGSGTGPLLFWPAGVKMNLESTMQRPMVGSKEAIERRRRIQPRGSDGRLEEGKEAAPRLAPAPVDVKAGSGADGPLLLLLLA